MFNKSRPLSWSAISSFKYDKEQWYKKYVLGIQEPENAEMRFGKLIGDKLAKDPTFLPSVPRLNTFEHPFRVVFNGIPLVGYADSFCTETKKKMKEYKTGVKKWDQKRADEHGQIDMYLLMHFITEKIRPEEMDVELIWLPTKRVEGGDFNVSITFVEPVQPQIFKTKRSMADVLNFGTDIIRTYKEMEAFALIHR